MLTSLFTTYKQSIWQIRCAYFFFVIFSRCSSHKVLSKSIFNFIRKYATTKNNKKNKKIFLNTAPWKKTETGHKHNFFFLLSNWKYFTRIVHELDAWILVEYDTQLLKYWLIYKSRILTYLSLYSELNKDSPFPSLYKLGGSDEKNEYFIDSDADERSLGSNLNKYLIKS